MGRGVGDVVAKHIAPIDAILEGLTLLDQLQALLPRRWDRFGDRVLVKMDPRLIPSLDVIAPIYCSVIGAEGLVVEAGSSGVLREPVILGTWGARGVTRHKEHGLWYVADPELVMFASGNIVERGVMGSIDAQGETVLDLFAGIGYLCLPMLVGSNAKHLIACELNPVAAGFLEEGARANGVVDRLEVRVGDSRHVAPVACADRILMGGFEDDPAFLTAALDALRLEGGVIHFHAISGQREPWPELLERISPVLDADGRPWKITREQVIKSMGPGQVHTVQDITIQAQ